MKNFWLEHAKEEDQLKNLDEVLMEHMYCVPPHEKLYEVFHIMAERILELSWPCCRIGPLEKEDLAMELVYLAFDKLHRFDPEKGRALNYFTTCMMGHLRQLYRRPVEKYPELKKRYYEHLRTLKIEGFAPKRT